MGLINKKPGQLRRIDVDDLRQTAGTVPSVITEAQIYADGGHRGYIERLMADRFATKIEKRTDDRTKAEVGYIAKSKEAAAAAIRYGLMEVCSLYTFPRIAGELATAYAYGVKYEYDSSAEAFAGDVRETREDAMHDQIMARVDWQSVCVGSSALLIQILGSRMNYQAIERPYIWACFEDEIYEDEELRPVDKNNIDEASCVILQMSGSDRKGNKKFVALFGASGKYPRGRMVTYLSQNWSSIPDINEGEEGTDHVDGSGIGNPLTIYKQSRGDNSLPEYPVVQWLGGVRGNNLALLPCDSNLYVQCRELDLAASRILLSTLKSARGLWKFSRDAGASSKFPDSIDEGIAGLEHGQQIEALSQPGANSQYAMDILSEIASHTASSYGVPAHRMNTKVGVQMPSGAALIEANKPLEQARQRRYNLNRSNAMRKFRIECALASMTNGTPVGEGVNESWQPNQEPVVTDRLSQMQQAEIGLNIGITDVERVAMEIYPQLDTLEKAQKYIEELKAKQPMPEAVQGAAQSRLMALRNGGGRLS